MVFGNTPMKNGKEVFMTHEERKQKRNQLLYKVTDFLYKKLEDLVIIREVGFERIIMISNEWNNLFEKYPQLESWIITNLEFPYMSERMEVLIGFPDEWYTCSECGAACRIHGCQYIEMETEIICIECSPDYFDEIIEAFNNQWNKALPYWIKDALLKNGWEKLNEDSYEAGLHEHQNDSPKQVFNKSTEELWQNLIFVVDSVSPFTVEFDIYGKRNELKEVTNVKTYTVHDVLKAGYILQPLRCVHCNKIGKVVFHQYIEDGYCQECGQWQLEEKEKK